MYTYRFSVDRQAIARILGAVIALLLVASVLGQMFLRFLLRLPADTRRWLLISGAVYLGGAVGMELIDGKYMEAHGANLTYMLMTTVEEGLEMSGLSALVITLLGHMATHSG